MKKYVAFWAGLLTVALGCTVYLVLSGKLPAPAASVASAKTLEPVWLELPGTQGILYRPSLTVLEDNISIEFNLNVIPGEDQICLDDDPSKTKANYNALWSDISKISGIQQLCLQEKNTVLIEKTGPSFKWESITPQILESLAKQFGRKIPPKPTLPKRKKHRSRGSTIRTRFFNFR